MLTRRSVLGVALAALAAPTVPARAAATLGEDGLYHLDWYLESFLDLKEDLEETTAKGKRLAVMWSLKGCPACKRMAEVHLADSKIENYIKTNFEVLHLNQIGVRETTDFDGAKLSEKALGQRYGIRFTPMIQFFPETVDGLAGRTPQAREVARMAGLLEPAEFLAMFQYVKEKGYETQPFPEWLKRRSA